MAHGNGCMQEALFPSSGSILTALTTHSTRLTRLDSLDRALIAFPFHFRFPTTTNHGPQQQQRRRFQAPVGHRQLPPGEGCRPAQPRPGPRAAQGLRGDVRVRAGQDDPPPVQAGCHQPKDFGWQWTGGGPAEGRERPPRAGGECNSVQ